MVHHHKHAGDAKRERQPGEHTIYDLIKRVVFLLMLCDTRQGTKMDVCPQLVKYLCGKESFWWLL
jgi:hypothetical protein